MFSLLLLGMVCAHHRAAVIEGSLGSLAGPVEMWYDPVAMVWWLLIFTPVWAVCGGLFNTDLKYAPLSMIRFRNLRQWWLPLMAKLMAAHVWYFVLLAGQYLLLWSREPWEEWKKFLLIILTLFLHSCAMMAGLIWLRIFGISAGTSLLVLLIAEAVGKLPVIMGIPPAADPFVWGMYGFSREYIGFDGFNLLLAYGVEILAGLTVFLIPVWRKKLILRSVGV